MDKTCKTCIHAGICKHQDEFEKDFIKVEDGIGTIIDYSATSLRVNIECKYWKAEQVSIGTIGTFPNNPIWPSDPLINPVKYTGTPPERISCPYEITC